MLKRRHQQLESLDANALAKGRVIHNQTLSTIGKGKSIQIEHTGLNVSAVVISYEGAMKESKVKKTSFWTNTFAITILDINYEFIKEYEKTIVPIQCTRSEYIKMQEQARAGPNRLLDESKIQEDGADHDEVIDDTKDEPLMTVYRLHNIVVESQEEREAKKLKKTGNPAAAAAPVIVPPVDNGAVAVDTLGANGEVIAEATETKKFIPSEYVYIAKGDVIKCGAKFVPGGSTFSPMEIVTGRGLGYFNHFLKMGSVQAKNDEATHADSSMEICENPPDSMRVMFEMGNVDEIQTSTKIIHFPGMMSPIFLSPSYKENFNIQLFNMERDDILWKKTDEQKKEDFMTFDIRTSGWLKLTGEPENIPTSISWHCTKTKILSRLLGITDVATWNSKAIWMKFMYFYVMGFTMLNKNKGIPENAADSFVSTADEYNVPGYNYLFYIRAIINNLAQNLNLITYPVSHAWLLENKAVLKDYGILIGKSLSELTYPKNLAELNEINNEDSGVTNLNEKSGSFDNYSQHDYVFRVLADYEFISEPEELGFDKLTDKEGEALISGKPLNGKSLKDHPLYISKLKKPKVLYAVRKRELLRGNKKSADPKKVAPTETGK